MRLWQNTKMRRLQPEGQPHSYAPRPHALTATLPALAAARHTFASIKRDDRSVILVAQPFGFGEDGRMNITVSDFVLYFPAASKQKGNYHK